MHIYVYSEGFTYISKLEYSGSIVSILLFSLTIPHGNPSKYPRMILIQSF